MTTFGKDRWEHCETTAAYAAQALAIDEAAAAEAHIAACSQCRRELESLRPVVDLFASWPTDVLRPAKSLQAQLALRIAGDTGSKAVAPPSSRWSEPDWEQVAPGIECKLLRQHAGASRPGHELSAAYPCRRGAAASLDGELWIDQRKLLPGDCNYGPPGASDERVWSETGCTCVLITSTKDTLR
jgi:hypothetical protein